MSSANISICMITMNEAGSIPTVMADIRRVAPEAEIVIVDSSQDDTPQLAESLGARVIRQFPPKGYGPAMDRVLRAATRDCIITLDCDNTYPTAAIPELAHLILEEKYDVVDGSRLKRKPQAMPWINYLANAGFALLASVLFARWITDLHSGMRAYRRGVVESLGYDPVGAALPVELLLRPMARGLRVKTIFIDYRERIGVSTMQPLQSAVWTLRRMLRARFGGRKP